MKNYHLRSVVGVQIASFVIVGLLVLITQFINDKVYLYEYAPAQDFLSIVLTPFYILINNSQYGNSFFLLLHSLCYFLFFSQVDGFGDAAHDYWEGLLQLLVGLLLSLYQVLVSMPMDNKVKRIGRNTPMKMRIILKKTTILIMKKEKILKIFSSQKKQGMMTRKK